jgi:type VII secretion-associated serine protease mycosin
MLSRRARLTVPGLALAGIAVLTGAAAPGSVGGQVRAAEQPQLRAIEAPAAWRLSQGHGVTVAVLDTGVDASAADLAGSVTTGPDYTLGADPPGYQPPHLHGTFIASIIAGHGSGPGDGGGIIGVAPAARVLSVRVILDDQEPGLSVYNSNSRFADAIDDGIRYATQHGAQVINMSLGTGEATRGMQSALGYAVSHGVLVVASAGNSGHPGAGFTPYSYPAAFTGVISVAAVNAAGQRAAFSDRNSSVELSAPGVGIIGAGPEGSYLQASGTSPASAFVAGVAGLIRSAYPRLSPAEVAQAMFSSARRRPPGGYSPSTGFGEVDAVAAVHAAGRLAAARPGAGLAASRRFGAALPGPVQVTHRDAGRIAVLAGVAAAGTAGVILALVLLTLLTVRTVRDRRRLSAASPAGPTGAAAPAAMRNVGLIELLESADPADTGLGDLAGPELAAGPGWLAGPDPEPGPETAP